MTSMTVSVLEGWEPGVASPEEIAALRVENMKALEGIELRAPEGASKNISLDPWKCLGFINWGHLWNDALHGTILPDVDPAEISMVPPIVRHLLDEPEIRTIVQKKLFYGFSRWWWNRYRNSGSARFGRGPLDMGPWIALIGMRLTGYRNAGWVDHNIRSSKSAEVVHMEILQLLLDLPSISAKENIENKREIEGLFWGESITVGQVLNQCYRLAILERPRRKDWKTYQWHTAELIRTLETFNLWHKVRDYDPFENMQSIEELARIKLSALWLASYVDCDTTSNPSSKVEIFQCRELSLEMLRKVGNLDIQWTDYITEHLELDIEYSIVKIFWFGFAAKACPITHIGCKDYNLKGCHDFHPNLSPIFGELSETYS